MLGLNDMSEYVYTENYDDQFYYYKSLVNELKSFDLLENVIGNYRGAVEKN